MKICTKCHIKKSLNDFYPHKGHKFGVGSHCKSCCAIDNAERHAIKQKNDPIYKKRRSEYSHDWHIKNKKKNNLRIANNHKKKRMLCIEHYGGKCACCGENRYEFLAIDHLSGGGRNHRKEIGAKIERWIIKNDFPEGFRILCHNCNQSLGLYGYCPHDIERKVIKESSHGKTKKE